MKIKRPVRAIVITYAVAIILLALILSVFLFADDNSEAVIPSQTEYKVTCVDDILTGKVIKKGGKYYRQGSDISVWIPLQQCALEPIK